MNLFFNVNSFFKAVTIMSLTIFSMYEANASCTHPTAYLETNTSTVTFEGVLYDFPSTGKSTWFYKIDNSKGSKGVSHTNFQVSTCIDNSKFNGGGTYTSMTSNGLNYSSDFKLGYDGSSSSGTYGIKFDREVATKSVTKVFFVINDKLQIGSNLVFVKTGNNFESDSICSPSISCTPVPVKLLYFTVQTMDGQPQLDWSTASERNNEGFYIEHSTNGEFNEIGFVESAHESNSVKKYTYTDRKNSWGYYRLKIVDYDGFKEYSPIVFLPGTEAPDFTLLYPTIAEDRITLSNEHTVLHTISIYNLSGLNIPFETDSYEHGEAISIHIENLPAGFYFIRVNEKETLRFIKR